MGSAATTTATPCLCIKAAEEDHINTPKTLNASLQAETEKR